MLVVTTSTHAVMSGGELNNDVVDELIELAESVEVGIISNQPEPEWFEEVFGGSEVEFRQWQRRQDGSVLKAVAEQCNVPPHKVLVLAASRDDVAMAKNGGAMLAGASWSQDEYVATVGLEVETPKKFSELVRLVDGWSGNSWFRAVGETYSIEAVCDISTINKAWKQVQFGEKVKKAVKGGGAGLSGLLAITSCVLSAGGMANAGKSMWGIYPSSSSGNDDTDVLSEFGHRLRTTVSTMRFAKRGEPLFIRHRKTEKRSQGGGDRTNPRSEVESIHLNSEYRPSVAGRNVVVLDDCTTYGVSMAVAAGLLHAARAKSVICLAVGKFGHCLRHFDVKVMSDPFKPIPAGKWTHNELDWVEAHQFKGAQDGLRNLLLGST